MLRFEKKLWDRGDTCFCEVFELSFSHTMTSSHRMTKT